MKNFLKALLVSTALGGLLPAAAYAGNLHVQSFTPGHTGNVNALSIATTGSAVGAGNHVMGFANCWAAVPPTVGSAGITDDKGNVYTIANTGTSAVLGSGTYRWVSFYLLNINNGPSTVTVPWSANCKYNNAIADEFSGSLAGLDVSTGQAQNGVVHGSNVITSGNVTPNMSGSLAYGASVDGAAIVETAGTGWTLGVNDQTANDDFAFSEYILSQPNTSIAATFTTTVDETVSQGASTAIMVFKPTALPTPVSATCTPANPVLADNSANSTAVCTYNVNMSDGSTFNGTATVAQQGCSSSCLFSLSGTTLQLARAAAVTDDGIQTALLNFTENGQNLPFSVNLQVTPAPAAGTPVAFGFKGVNPGTSDTPQSGTVIFTAPRPMAVMAITGRVSEPLGGTGVVDVYKAGSGTPCASGIKLHTGDFNANGTVDVNQPLALSLINDTSVTGNTHTSTTIDSLSTNVTLRGWEVGDTITGSGIPANDTIASIAAGGLSLTLANATTTTVTTDALTVATLPLAQGDNVCITTTGSQWSTPAAVDATVTVTAQ